MLLSLHNVLVATPLPYEALRLVQRCINQLIFFWSEAATILPNGYKGSTQ